jgi:hypothetical protein
LHLVASRTPSLLCRPPIAQVRIDQALGLDVPPTLLARADEVIE